MKFTIYVSNEPADDIIAIKLKNLLETVFQNCDVILSSRDPSGGMMWIKETRDSLRGASVIISVITSISLKGSWVIFESGTGFWENKSLLLCTDSVMLQDLEPPLSLMTARTLTMDGLQVLMDDVARIAEVPKPATCPGIPEAVSAVNQFLLIRNQTIEAENNGEGSSGLMFGSDMTPILDNSDAEIDDAVAALEEKLRQILVALISRAGESGSLPGKEQLNGMMLQDLVEIARSNNIPFPHQEIRCYQYVQLSSSDAQKSPWRKMNCIAKIEDALEGLQRLERSFV